MLFVYDKENSNYLVGDTEDYSLETVSKQDLLKAYSNELEVRGLSDKGISTNWYKQDLGLNLDDIDIIRFKTIYPKLIAEHLILKPETIYLLYDRVDETKLRLINGSTKRFVDISEFTILVNLLENVKIYGCSLRDNKLVLNFNWLAMFKAKSNLLGKDTVNKILEDCGLQITEQGYITNKGTSLSLAKFITEPQKLKVSDLSKLPNIQHIPAMYFNAKVFDTLSNIDVSKVTDMTSLFSIYPGSLPDIGNWDVSNVEDMSFMFAGTNGDRGKLDLSKWNTKSLKTTYNMFSDSAIRFLDIKNWDLSCLENMGAMFKAASYLVELDLSGIVAPNVTNVAELFRACCSLKLLNLAGFKTGPVESMSHTFSSISAEFLDVSGFDTSKCKDFSFTFYNCKSLIELDLGAWITTNVIDMNSMFENCSSLEELNISKWNVTNVEDMTHLFDGCEKLKRLDLSAWNTSNVKDMHSMFENCSSLEELDISKWDVTNVKDMDYLFRGCTKLKRLDLSTWHANCSMTYMFSICDSLQEILVNQAFADQYIQSNSVLHPKMKIV